MPVLINNKKIAFKLAEVCTFQMVVNFIQLHVYDSHDSVLRFIRSANLQGYFLTYLEESAYPNQENHINKKNLYFRQDLESGQSSLEMFTETKNP